MSFEYLKNKYRVSTEQIFGIPEQIDPQCPVVDEIIKQINNESSDVKSCYKELKSGSENIDLDDIANTLDNVRYNLDTLDIERLRDAIVSLREWGQGWKDLCGDIIATEDINTDKYVQL